MSLTPRELVHAESLKDLKAQALATIEKIDVELDGLAGNAKAVVAAAIEKIEEVVGPPADKKPAPKSTK